MLYNITCLSVRGKQIHMPGWSSGLGRCPLTAVTGVRLPYQVPQNKRYLLYRLFCIIRAVVEPLYYLRQQIVSAQRHDVWTNNSISLRRGCRLPYQVPQKKQC